MNFKKRSIGFSFAWNGLKKVAKSERNFQIHLLATLLVIGMAIFLKLSVVEWAIIMIVIGFVLVTELINSAIERIIDYLRPEIHPLAKIIKDIGAGAVLLSAVIAVSVGLFIFLPKLIILIN